MSNIKKNIEEFSVFDGPGIRTSVFIKGCPLRCEWCHNPEGQSFDNFIMRSENGCIGCGNCLKHAASTPSGVRFTLDSIKNCPLALLRYSAREYTAEELCRELEKNIPILNSSGGGVTFSGGEPTASPDFLLECLDLLNGKTHRAVQTSGFCPAVVFEKVLSRVEYILLDLKLIREDLHKRYTGVSNKVILDNFRALTRSGIDFVIRVPLIPTVTDTEENVENLARLLSESGVKYVELLPYNKMAGAKYKLSGKVYAPSFDETVSPNPRTEIFERYGIKSVIM
jgi:pyruvate formate lyase activating enzyme